MSKELRRSCCKTPSREQLSDGQDTARQVVDALEEIHQRPDRDPETGRFIEGNLAAGRTLARSETLWSALSGAKADLMSKVRADLVADEGAAETLQGLVESYVEVRLLRSSLFIRLSETAGPVTGKGRVRSLFTAYLATVDKETRLATTLGLERRARRIPTLEEVMADGD